MLGGAKADSWFLQGFYSIMPQLAMLEIGSTHVATITHTEPYGVFLAVGGDRVFVHGIEIRWPAAPDPLAGKAAGDAIKVLILRLNYRKRIYAASIRRLFPEQNPYRRLSRLPPDECLDGRLVAYQGNHGVVRFSDGAIGYIPIHLLGPQTGPMPRDIRVKIDALEVDKGFLDLVPAPGSV